MKRLLLAGSFAVLFALSRVGANAERNDAFASLIGMAESASSDKGPQADLDKMPAAPIAPQVLKTDSLAPAAKRPRVQPRREDDLAAVAVPPASAPRVWTKLFAALLPAMTRTPSFEVAASTAAGRARVKTEPQTTAASAAGSAQGLLELVAAATAPSR